MMGNRAYGKWTGILLATLLFVFLGAVGAKSEEKALILGEDGTVTETAEIDWNGKAQFSFVPDETGYYEFYAISNQDTYCYLYDAEMNQLAFDEASGSGYNFYLRQELTAGTTYYYYSYMRNSQPPASFTVCLSRFIGLLSAEPLNGEFTLYTDPGGSVELGITTTTTDENSLTCVWYDDSSEDPIAGVDTVSWTASDINRNTIYTCVVSDDQGHSLQVNINVCVRNGLSAEANCPNDIVTFSGTDVMMSVTEKHNEGKVRYQWYYSGH